MNMDTDTLRWRDHCWIILAALLALAGLAGHVATQPAAVPPMPWLSTKAPAAPGVSASAQGGNTTVRCTLECKGSTDPIDEVRAMLIYRIVQESLTNVSRYAKASEVKILICFGAQEIDVSIADDGCGFDPGEVLIKKTFGLLGMRERALTLGGDLMILSRPGRGTTIAVKVPLKRQAQEVTP